MADCRAALKSSIILLACIVQFTLADEPVDTAKVAIDSTHTDTPIEINDTDDIDVDDELEYADSSFIGPIDPTLLKQIINLPGAAPFEPVYRTYITQKGLGDIIRYRTGVFMLQHGSVGHPEMITKSLLLPGAGAVYNGIPVFHQGTYFPFRSGADLTGLMSDNISGLEITPISYLNLFSEGEILSLKSTVWPTSDNPSSVTHAQGPYSYERTTWRFSRRFRENVSATFTAAFKEFTGYYSSGDDYDDFRVSGSAAYKPRSNFEIQYSFYQHKALQGLVQYDRTVTPTIRSHNDINHHAFKANYQYSRSFLLTFDSYYQFNYNHVYDNTYSYSYKVKDDIKGVIAGAELSSGNNLFKIKAGWQRQVLKKINTYEPVSSTIGILITDSLQIADNHAAILTGRVRYNNKTDFNVAGTARYKIGWLTLMGGAYDGSPDLYAMYFAPPQISFSEDAAVKSYTYMPDPALDSKRTVFGGGSLSIPLLDGISVELGATYEDVSDDLVPEVYNTDSAFSSNQLNIDYKRLSFTTDLYYQITRFFSGRSGVTLFSYDPTEVLPGIKHSPSIVAFAMGELVIPEVLRDIDLSGAFQARYYSKRYYSGFSNDVFFRSKYKQAIVLDGSLAMRFGSFEFRISEENIADFFTQNLYNLWGEYSMPQATVWWQFTWKFYD